MNTITHPHGAKVRWGAGAVIAFLFALLLLLPLSGVANAAQVDADEQDQVVLSGQVTVGADETVHDVVIAHGSATIEGVVRGSLVVFDGPVTVAGEVAGDVVVLNGNVTVAQGARIGGDLVSPRTPQVAEGAVIAGDVQRLTTDWRLDEIALSRWVSWLAVSVSTLALGLLLLIFAPRAADAAVRTARTRLGAALAWGVAIAIGLPIVAVIAILTIVGIPFGVGLLLAFALLYAVGYVTAAWLVGRLIRPQLTSRLAAFMIGWAIFRVVALVPFIDGLLWFPGAALGLGVLCAAAWEARTTAASPLATPRPPAEATT
jgi:cytoskeletal protein CcmA (bactofilin family)